MDQMAALKHLRSLADGLGGGHDGIGVDAWLM